MAIKTRNHKPKCLTRAVDECFYGSGHGRYAHCGKWEIGLGGYDMGYEIYCNNRAIMQIKPNDHVIVLNDESTTARVTNHTVEQIFQALKEVESCLVLDEE